MIYVSTGGFSKENPFKIIKKLNKNKIFNIELSSGLYSRNLKTKLSKLKKKNNFLIHNYFPVPKNPFVLNLASLNKSINKKSFNHVKKAIILSSQLKSKYYSFHAGFYLDPKIQSLGKKFDRAKLYNKKISQKIFFQNLKKLAKFAKEKKVRLLIENNVITKSNIKKYKTNPLMMCDANEIKKFKARLKNSVGILLDTGHLKVSCNTLKKNFNQELNSVKSIVEAYHLSDNNGIEDSNKPILKNSRIWKYLNYKTNYFTIEVYTNNIKKLSQQVNIIKNKINGHTK